MHQKFQRVGGVFINKTRGDGGVTEQKGNGVQKNSGVNKSASARVVQQPGDQAGA